MDRYEIRSAINNAFEKSNKRSFLDVLEKEDMDFCADAIMDYVRHASACEDELEKLRLMIKELGINKSGLRTHCIRLLSKNKALVQIGPLKEEVVISPSVNIKLLKPGVEVFVVGSAEGRLITGIRKSKLTNGRLGKIHKVLGDRVVIDDAGNELIMQLCHDLICKEGDKVRYDPESGIVMEVIDSETSSYMVTDIPKITFDDVKGLEKEKEFLKERIIYPCIYKEKFQKYGLKPIRAAILHGAPGCGKTFISKALFNEMSKCNGKGFFLINGPQLLSKWAGETEAAIRNVFDQAKKIAKETGLPSLIFWDEIESITRKRTDSASYSPEKTVVPTILAELQGLDSDHDIILIAATNRPELIDPALMRPGRLGDAIIEIPRPTKGAAIEILKSFLKEHLLSNEIDELASYIYDNEKPIAKTKLEDGTINIIMRKDYVSGALFAQIGEEILRKLCLAEINEKQKPEIGDFVQHIENILLSQVGILDSGIKNSFEFSTQNHITEITLDS